MLSCGMNFWCWDMKLAVKLGISRCCSLGLSTLGWCSGFGTPHNHDCWLWHLYVQIVAIQLYYRTWTIMCIVMYNNTFPFEPWMQAWRQGCIHCIIFYAMLMNGALVKSSTQSNTTQAVGPLFWCWFGEAWPGCPWLLWSRSLCLLFFEIFWNNLISSFSCASYNFRFWWFRRLLFAFLFEVVNVAEHRYHTIPSPVFRLNPCHVPVSLHEVWWVLYVLLLI